MTLRTQCVEAAAKRLVRGRSPLGRRDDWLDGKIRREAERDAIAVLDAILDTLQANADEDGWIAFIDSDGEIGVDLIDALTDSVGVEVDQ